MGESAKTGFREIPNMPIVRCALCVVREAIWKGLLKRPFSRDPFFPILTVLHSGTRSEPLLHTARMKKLYFAISAFTFSSISR